jgi:hypothetical protein
MGWLSHPQAMGWLSHPQAMGWLSRPQAMGWLSHPQAMGWLSHPQAMGWLSHPQAMGLCLALLLANKGGVFGSLCSFGSPNVAMLFSLPDTPFLYQRDHTLMSVAER